jgi:hypothetical protein
MESLHVAVDAWKRLWEKGKEHTYAKKTKKSKNKQKKNSTRRGKRETIQKYYQRSMQGKNLDKTDVEVYGDKMQAKGEEIFRVGFQNIQNLSENAKAAKSRQSVSYIVKRQ